MQDDAEDQDPLAWVDPPLREEEIAALRAMGARFARGGELRDFEPVKPRPRWLAFLVRVLRIDSGELDDCSDELAPLNAEFTAEERAELSKIGWREGCGQFDPNWKPVPKRPRWLAFIYRTFRLRDD